jgi:hypothetical protein
MHCPSAQPDDPQAAVLGIVRRGEGPAQVQILPQMLPPETLTVLVPSSLRPTEVLRFAAPCVEQQCTHFDGNRCLLAHRIAGGLPAVVERLPPCAIRRTCRWFAQESTEACRRCPQIITEPYVPSNVMREVSRPTNKGESACPQENRPELM